MKQINITLAALILVVSVFFNSSPVSAQSAFDDAYQITTSLELVDEYSGPASCRLDLGATFATVMRNADYWLNPNIYDDVIASYDRTVANNGSQALALAQVEMSGELYSQAVLVWSETPGTPLTWSYNSSTDTSSVSVFAQYSIGISMDMNDCQPLIGVGANKNVTISNDGDLDNSDSVQVRNFMSYNWDSNYPLNYAGLPIQNALTIDNDGDGLSLAREFEQGTSDAGVDMDKDGISDFKESRWFEDRDEVFCDTSIPKNCTYPDPLKKDIYVEVDWMDDGVVAYKPTNAQLEIVVNMFDEEGINVHFDTGNYGGGNELTDYATALRQDSVVSVPDFADYKVGGDGVSRNFADKRGSIWRYMISGNQYSRAAGVKASSGWAELLGDDLFIAIGYTNNLTGIVDGDRAIAGTIAHELGHGLCLADSRVYMEQSADCVFRGIDNNTGHPPVNNPDDYFNLEKYESVMNYRYQLTNIDDLGSVQFSDGTKGSKDHDDWSAVKEHVGAFAGSHMLYIEFGARSPSKAVDTRPTSADGLIVVESTN